MSEVSINIKMDEGLPGDPFYRAVNITRLERVVNAIRSGKAVLTEHELIDAD